MYTAHIGAIGTLHLIIMYPKVYGLVISRPVARDTLFLLIYESLLYWWEHNDKLFTYLQFDYFFRLGYEYLPAMRHCIDALPVRPYGMLRKILDSAYEANRWEQVIGEAPFHKLSYKKYTTKCTKQGELTHYAHLLELDKGLETRKEIIFCRAFCGVTFIAYLCKKNQ